MSPRFIQLGLLSLLSTALAAPIVPSGGLAISTVSAGNGTDCDQGAAAPTGRQHSRKNAAPAPAADASPAASPATSSGSTSGKKAGVAYNDASIVSNFVGKGNVGWAYNWNANPGSLPKGIEYVPILWGTQSTFTSSWVDAATKAIANGATAVVGFNEPDHPQQANLDAATAAKAYKQYITNNFAGKARLISPSVTNGGAPMGLTYLQNFMSACSDCKIDAINIHWYDSSTNIDYFKSYIQQAYNTFKKPIWLTEFGTINGNDDAFLKQVQPWLNSQSYVERYAYFMAANGKLLSGTSLSAAGTTYAST